MGSDFASITTGRIGVHSLAFLIVVLSIVMVCVSGLVMP